jgi:putative nucleotidyltransferase with HDIG domain
MPDARLPNEPTTVLELETLKDTITQHLLSRLRRHHLGTYKHSTRVARLAGDLVKVLSVGEPAGRRLRRAALLHDVGKVEVPIRILDKDAALTPTEWACMDRHSDAGGALVHETRLLDDEAYLVRNHHRWYAANNCLSSSYDEDLDADIDIISVCDAYDAMVSERPYSGPRDRADAVAELQSYAGEQFNPDVVSALNGMIEQGDEPCWPRVLRN